jgi:hypothetical protein
VLFFPYFVFQKWMLGAAVIEIYGAICVRLLSPAAFPFHVTIEVLLSDR